jgi:hypothetical protein
LISKSLILLKVPIWVNLHLDIFLLTARSNFKMNTILLFFWQSINLILKFTNILIICFNMIVHWYTLITWNQIIMQQGQAILFFSTWSPLHTPRRVFLLEIYISPESFLRASKRLSDILDTEIRVVIMHFVRQMTSCLFQLLRVLNWWLNYCRLFCYFV